MAEIRNDDRHTMTRNLSLAYYPKKKTLIGVKPNYTGDYDNTINMVLHPGRQFLIRNCNTVLETPQVTRKLAVTLASL